MQKWFERTADNSDIVISTRLRLARNVSSLPFKNKMTSEQMRELNNSVKAVLETANLGNNHFEYFKLDELSDIKKLALVEKHLVSRNFIENSQDKLLALSQDNSISIMVNEEDHIRIQVLSSGLALNDAYAVCDRLDNLLNEQLDFSFSDKLGFLTSCPTNLGTGLRASVMLHLPAIEKRHGMEQLIKATQRLGLTIRGTYGEGTEAIGSIYQLSNQVTLGLSEQTAIDNLLNVTLQIIETERKLRHELLEDNLLFANEIYKSCGILKYSRLLPSREFDRHISNVRVGVCEGLLDEVSVESINKLYNMVYSATLCDDNNKQYTANERDYHRAELVRGMFR